MKRLLALLLVLPLAGCGYADAAMQGARPVPSGAVTDPNAECVINAVLGPTLYEQYLRGTSPEYNQVMAVIKDLQRSVHTYCTVNVAQADQFTPAVAMVSVYYRLNEPN